MRCAFRNCHVFLCSKIGHYLPVGSWLNLTLPHREFCKKCDRNFTSNWRLRKNTHLIPDSFFHEEKQGWHHHVSQKLPYLSRQQNPHQMQIVVQINPAPSDRDQGLVVSQATWSQSCDHNGKRNSPVHHVERAQKSIRCVFVAPDDDHVEVHGNAHRPEKRADVGEGRQSALHFTGQWVVSEIFDGSVKVRSSSYEICYREVHDDFPGVSPDSGPREERHNDQ